MRRWVALLAAVWLVAGAPYAATAIEFLDRLDEALRFESPGKLLRVHLSGRFDLEGYWIDQHSPGLIFGPGDESFVNPRLVLFGDAWVGRRLYAFVQARVDRGFDPREEIRDARADEYLLRYTPFDQPVLNLHAGKFATVVGNWVLRHDAWNNPFVTAPIPYERVTTVGDGVPAARTSEFVARRELPDMRDKWVPVIWGPSYAAGGAAFGRVGIVEYAVEVKNAALSARPEEWDPTSRDWSEPTVSGRVGVRPGAAWVVGVSGSSGAYLREKAQGALDPVATEDFRETVIGMDARWAWRHLELWAELFAARFEVPIKSARNRILTDVHDADTLAYYVEGRYQIVPSLFVALRAGQQLFGKVENEVSDRDVAWDRDLWRTDTAITYRFDRHLQAKLQYSIGRQTGSLQQGEQLVAAQVTIRF